MSSRLELVKRMLTAFESHDYKEVEPFLSDGFKAQVLPATLNNPERDREEYLKWYGAAFATLEKAKFEILDTVEGKDTFVLHARNAGIFKDGTPYNNEYMMIWWFDENDKVIYLKEFFDSAYTESVRSKLFPSQ